MSTTRTPRRPTEDLRRDALAEARALLAEGGPEQVKARVLAVRLGVSVGTIYNLFGDLDELLFHVSAQVYDDLLETVSKAAAAEKSVSPTARLLTVAWTYLRFVSERQALWAGVLAFNRKPKTGVPAWYREKQRALFGVLAEIIEDFPAAAKGNAQRVAPLALWAAVHGIISVSVGEDGMMGTEQEVRTQIELVVRAVGRDLGDPEAGSLFGS